MEPIVDLDDLALDVLWTLPVAPAGLSVAELAEDLIGDRSPRGRAKISRALAAVHLAVNLDVGRGADGLGRAGVKLYGVPPGEMPRVRRCAIFLDRHARKGLSECWRAIPFRAD